MSQLVIKIFVLLAQLGVGAADAKPDDASVEHITAEVAAARPPVPAPRYRYIDGERVEYDHTPDEHDWDEFDHSSDECEGW